MLKSGPVNYGPNTVMWGIECAGNEPVGRGYYNFVIPMMLYKVIQLLELTLWLYSGFCVKNANNLTLWHKL